MFLILASRAERSALREQKAPGSETVDVSSLTTLAEGDYSICWGVPFEQSSLNIVYVLFSNGRVYYVWGDIYIWQSEATQRLYVCLCERVSSTSLFQFSICWALIKLNLFIFKTNWILFPIWLGWIMIFCTWVWVYQLCCKYIVCL